MLDGQPRRCGVRLTSGRPTARTVPATPTVEVTDMLHTEHLMDHPPAMAEIVGAVEAEHEDEQGAKPAHRAPV